MPRMDRLLQRQIAHDVNLCTIMKLCTTLLIAEQLESCNQDVILKLLDCTSFHSVAEP